MDETSRAIAQAAAAWFRREEWDEVKRLCVDDLQDTFDDWLRDAEAQLAAHAAEGLLIEKVIVTPDDIRRRQRSTGRKVNANGRAKIAIHKLTQLDDGRARH